jgi:hypothetical protein
MSLGVAFGHGHTLDLGESIEPDDAMHGVVFERACSVYIRGDSFGVLRCIGVTRAELNFARDSGAAALLEELRRAGVYPTTILRRPSLL